MREFDYSLDYEHLDLRRRPDLYRIGRGEQGVLLVQPYKGEILPHWRFRTVAEARQSATAIYALFRRYKAQGDFVGMDMARKYLQMGFTRARRYANRSSGRKYEKGTRRLLPLKRDSVKAAAAVVFRDHWDRVRRDPDYLAARAEHRRRFEAAAADARVRAVSAPRRTVSDAARARTVRRSRAPRPPR
jgi:hypothetical protein